MLQGNLRLSYRRVKLSVCPVIEVSGLDSAHFFKNLFALCTDVVTYNTALDNNNLCTVRKKLVANFLKFI